jgi:hypothetical protein
VSKSKSRELSPQPTDELVDFVDPIPVVAKRWNTSEDTIMREVARGALKITRLGPRRRGLRRSEQRRYLDAHTG